MGIPALDEVTEITKHSISYYDEHWPFEFPKNFVEMVMFRNLQFRIVRQVLGGRFVQNENGTWLKVNKYFDSDLMNQVVDFEEWI